MIKAPTITSLRVFKLGANFLHLKWDDVGSNFFYIVEYAIDNNDGVYSWTQRGVTPDPEWFEDRILAPNTKYIFRISTTFKGFDPSDWVYSESLETFDTNAYSISTMSQLIPNNVFVKNKLTDNKSYVNFNKDPIYATLMNENFVYDPGIANITNIENYVAADEESHLVQDTVEKVCVSVDRTYLGYKDDVLYTFERYQNMAKVSNDGGQNWWYYQALTGRIGYPIARTIMYQNSNSSFLLGYDDVFYGRQSDEIRFSSNTHYWSDDQITFVRMDVDASIPFKTLVFGRYTSYPDIIRRKVEAQAASNQWIYAVAEDNFKRILVKNAPIGTDGAGNTVRMWDTTDYHITGNPLCVTKKLDVFKDKCYALVTGKVATMETDRRNPNNVLPATEAGIYRFDEVYIPEVFKLGNINAGGYTAGIDFDKMIVTFAGGSHAGKVNTSWENRVFRGKNGVQMTVVRTISSKNKDAFIFDADLKDADGNLVQSKVNAFKAAFANPNEFSLIMENGAIVAPGIPNGGSWVKVFGKTEKERQSIEHKFSNMSTDGERVFVSSAAYEFDETVIDEDLPQKYPDDVSSAVKYSSEYPYLSYKRHHFYVWKSEDGETYERRPQTYYNEANFSWMATHGQRCWISHDNKAVVINPRKSHTYRLDPEFKINKEVWDKGNVKFYLENVKFAGFTQYCNGIMIHKGFDRERNAGGEIVAYYEYPYRVRDNAAIVWRPELVMMEASLQDQIRELPPVVEDDTGLVDPDLSHFIRIMGPEAYFDDESNFTKFGEYYLKYISEGTDTYYNRLLNLIKNKYPRESDNFEYLWSEIRRRNIYLDQEKRDAVIRFFESKAANFYSSKGTEASYKFLFKLLYDADVEIEVESSVGIDYDIVVKSANVDQDLVGRTIYTKTGRANVTYIERIYDNGLLRWKITLHNLIGKYVEGQIIKSESTAFEGEIVRGVKGKELAYSDIDYINRNRSYYVMKIRSELNTARYRDDILRFVHPVGFGFIGIAMLTVFINGGISMVPQQTMIEINKTYRWDSGLPSVTPKLKTSVNPDSPLTDPDPLFDAKTGELIEVSVPQTAFDITIWQNAKGENGVAYGGRNYDANETNVTWNNKVYKPSERRLEWSPLFSDFSTRFSDYRRLVEQRLKDDMKDPRDVSHLVTLKEPSQTRIGE